MTEGDNTEEHTLSAKDGAVERDHKEEVGQGDTNKDDQQMTFREKWMQNKEFRRNCMRTFWLSASLWAMGIVFSQKGPTFLDIQIITSTDVEEASFFFMAFSLGYLLGSLVAGVLYEKMNKQLLSLLNIVGMAVCTVAVPWCSPYALMIAINFVTAYFASGVDVVGNAEIVRIWGKDSAVPMQFLQFCAAFGGVISPLIAEPFLTPVPEDDLAVHSTTLPPTIVQLSGSNVTVTESSVSGEEEALNSSLVTAANVTGNATSPAAVLPLTTDVHYAFMISGAITLLVAIPFMVNLYKERYQKRRQEKKDAEEEAKQKLPLRLYLLTSVVLCFFYFLDCCIDDTFAAFLATFVVKQLHWSKSQGAQISSVFWGSFALGRCLSVFVANYLSSLQLLVVCCIAMIASLFGVYMFADHAINAGVWVSTVIASMSLGPIFGAGLTWAEQELIPVTGRMVSIIIIVSAAGNMVNPVITGFLMQEFTPMWFCYLLFAESIVCFAVLLTLMAIARFLVSKYTIHQSRELELNVPGVENEHESDAEL